MRTHFRNCSLCEAMCGLKIELDGDRVHSIRGDKDDPFSQGYICPKALALQDLHEDPDRLRGPMRRRAGQWEPIGWDEAITETTERLHGLQVAHGRDSIAAYLGNPNVHNLGMMLYGPSFLRTLRTKNRFSATSVDQLPAMLLSYWMFGHQLLIPIPDVDRTDYFLVVGANPLASNGSLMSAPGMRHRLRKLRERGGKLVVIDPRRSETAAAADAHHFVRPGSDAFLLLAVVREVIEITSEGHRGSGGGDRLGPLVEICDGLGAVRDAVAPFTAQLAATRCGVAAELVGELAGELLARDRAVVYGRVGACTQAYGALTMWAINLLNLVTGHLDREGGAMFTEPALDVVDAPRGFGVGPGSFARWRSRVRGLPEFGGELPAACMAEEMTDTQVEGTRIRGLVTIAGNPVLSTPNGGRLDAALEDIDFYVAIDPYLNETTRHADIILPPTSILERSHYDVVFAALAIRNVAKWSPAAIEPGANGKHDWEIVHALGESLETLRSTDGAQRGLIRRTRERALGWLGPDRLVDLGLRLGRHRLSRRKLEREPHGIDLGPMRSCLEGRLPTGRIDLAPVAVVKDTERLLADPSFDDPSLVLIGRRHLRSNNSWMHNVRKLVDGPERCTVLMHPADAENRGLEDGAMVLVQSRVGRVRLPLAVTEDMMVGVVSVPHGWGHGREGVELRVAREHAGASINDLTDDLLVDAVSGVAALSGVRVKITAA